MAVRPPDSWGRHGLLRRVRTDARLPSCGAVALGAARGCSRLYLSVSQLRTSRPTDSSGTCEVPRPLPVDGHSPRRDSARGAPPPAGTAHSPGGRLSHGLGTGDVPDVICSPV